MLRKYLSHASAVRRALVSGTQRRHSFRLLRSLMNPDYTLAAAVPWIPFDAIDYIGRKLPHGARVFEYGSGGSTLFWLKRGASCVSVEHDHDWFLRMNALLMDHCPVDLRWVPPENGRIGNGDPGDPADYASSDPNNLGKNFRRYASQIDEFPDDYFDLVVVDGRSRPSCLVHSLRKIRVGGMLLLDNSDRDYYLRSVKERLVGFESLQFSGATPGLVVWSQSTVFIRQTSD